MTIRRGRPSLNIPYNIIINLDKLDHNFPNLK
jgi:hypothetical protein